MLFRSAALHLLRAGVEQVKGCVTQTKFPVYSCVEGIEPNTSAKNLCLDTKDLRQRIERRGALPGDNARSMPGTGAQARA